MVITRAAAADVTEARNWYEEQQSGMGKRFLDEIEATLTRISAGPDRYPIVIRDARRALVHIFPYAIYFRVKAQTLRVIAVVHHSRDPRRWHSRLGS